MIPYIFHAGFLIAGFLIFYKVLLKRETFFKLNRIILIMGIVLAFILPMIPIPQTWSLRSKIYQAEQPVSSGSENQSAINHVSALFNANLTQSEDVLSKVGSWAFYLFWLGVIIFGINFFIQLFILIWRAKFNPSVMDNGFRIVELSGDKAPCSFGKSIFINPAKYDWDTYNQILQHEKVHIRQGHLVDILLAEVMIIFQWFNPFAWWYRTEIDNNLEFLTDDNLVYSQKIDKESYQMSLLKVSAPHFPLGLTTNYNQSLLKRRLAMMNAKRSNFNVLWKYISLIPILMLFVCGLNKSLAQKKIAPDTRKLPVDKESRSENEQAKPNNILNENDKAKSFKPIRSSVNKRITGKQETLKSVDSIDLFSIKNLGIDLEYIRSFKEIGYNKLSLQDLKVLRMQGVTAAYLKGFKDIGYDNLSVKTIVDLKLNGITPQYVKGLLDAGYTGISLNKLAPRK